MLQKLQPTKEINVDGVKYIVQLYAPSFGLMLHAKLLRLLGEPFVKLFGMLKGGKNFDVKALLAGDLSGLNIDAAGEALGLLFEKVKEDEIFPLIQEILSGTLLSTKQPVNEVFETHLMGRYGHIYKLVAKSLGAQYPDFLSGLAKRVSAAKSSPASESEEKSPT